MATVNVMVVPTSTMDPAFRDCLRTRSGRADAEYWFRRLTVNPRPVSAPLASAYAMPRTSGIWTTGEAAGDGLADRGGAGVSSGSSATERAHPARRRSKTAVASRSFTFSCTPFAGMIRGMRPIGHDWVSHQMRQGSKRRSSAAPWGGDGPEDILAAVPPGRGRRGLPPSSSGPGYRPFKAETRVRIPLGARELHRVP